eukprot:5766421-Amphidinium_carterae.1
MANCPAEPACDANFSLIVMGCAALLQATLHRLVWLMSSPFGTGDCLGEVLVVGCCIESSLDTGGFARPWGVLCFKQGSFEIGSQFHGLLSALAGVFSSPVG